MFVVLEIGTRRIQHWNVTEHPTADWTAQQFRMIVQGDRAYQALRQGLRVVEVPITFVERTHGTSKMSRAIVVEAMWRLSEWGLTARAGRFRRAVQR